MKSMNEQSPKELYAKETLIGAGAACFSIIVMLTVLGGGDRVAFVDAIYLMLFAFMTPFVMIPQAPWMVLVIALAGFGIYHQYRRVQPKFMRYLVGGEVVAWQFVGLQIIKGMFAVH